MIVPRPTPETLPFWEGCATGELRYQQCGTCATVQVYPRIACQHCRSTNLAWRRSERRGRIEAITQVHRAPLPAFAVPYWLAIVSLTEGFRLMVNIGGAGETPPAIGAPVEIVFIEHSGMILPMGLVT